MFNFFPSNFYGKIKPVREIEAVKKYIHFFPLQQQTKLIKN